MNHKEYIIPIGEEAKEFDEMFIGVIRKQPELIRCKNCKYFYPAGVLEDFPECVGAWNDGSVAVMSRTSPEGYCYRAERKEE